MHFAVWHLFNIEIKKTTIDVFLESYFKNAFLSPNLSIIYRGLKITRLHCRSNLEKGLMRLSVVVINEINFKLIIAFHN